MRTLLASLVQLGLLTYFYSDPAGRSVFGAVYPFLLPANSGLLLFLSYQAFRQQRVIVAVLTALLAFPGMALLVAALAFWSNKL